MSFRNVEPSPAIEEHVRTRAAELERFSSDIGSCDVIVEAPHRHQHQGVLYHVRIRLVVSGEELIVSRDPPEAHAHEELHVAIRDAFDAARRQLEDHVRKERERRRGASRGAGLSDLAAPHRG
jgi:ribosomal subunit interface protein